MVVWETVKTALGIAGGAAFLGATLYGIYRGMQSEQREAELYQTIKSSGGTASATGFGQAQTGGISWTWIILLAGVAILAIVILRRR